MKVLVVFAVFVGVAFCQNMVAYTSSQVMDITPSAVGRAAFTNVPAFPSGANISLSWQGDGCSFKVCANWLIRVYDDVSLAKQNCKSFGPYDWDSSLNGAVRQWNPTPGYNHFILWLNNGTTCKTTLTVSGQACADGYLGPNCEAPTPLAFNTTKQVNINDNSPLYYQIVFPQYTFGNKLIISITSSSNNPTLWAYWRLGNYPSVAAPAKYDGSASFSNTNSLEITIDNPVTTRFQQQIFNEYAYYLYLISDNEDNISIDIIWTVTKCDFFMKGPKCDQFAGPVPSTLTSETTLRSPSWYFGTPIFPFESATSLKVGVEPLNDQYLPFILLKLGNIPTYYPENKTGDFDMLISMSKKGEGVYYDSGLTAMNNGLWYIGLYANDSTQFGTTGFWFTTDCPQNCTSQGNCSNHICTCDKGFSINGFDCSEQGTKQVAAASSSSGGMNGAEITLLVFVILLFIVLVVSFAANGFLAYKWRKRSNYEAM